MEKPETCPVCYEDLNDEKNSLICGHWVHMSCIKKQFKPECPLCRKHLKNVVVTGEKPITYVSAGPPTILDEDFEREDEGPEIENSIWDDEENTRENTHMSKGYTYWEEDPDYDEENPCGDEFEYEDV